MIALFIFSLGLSQRSKPGKRRCLGEERRARRPWLSLVKSARFLWQTCRSALQGPGPWGCFRSGVLIGGLVFPRTSPPRLLCYCHRFLGFPHLFRLGELKHLLLL